MAAQDGITHCDLILRQKAGITILINTRLNKFGGSQSKLIIRQLGSAYTVHVHSAGDKNEIGLVMFISLAQDSRTKDYGPSVGSHLHSRRY